MTTITIPDRDNISPPKAPVQLDSFPDVNPEIAWELANLIRIAATDYQSFSNWFNDLNKEEVIKHFTLEEGRKLDGRRK